MRVAMYYANADVRLEEMPVPEIGDDELLMKVEASGICGSDVMEWYRRDKVPLVLGHEVAGTVENVGDAVTKFKPGDRTVVTHHVPCNTCHYCLQGHHTCCETLQRGTRFHPGGFSEFIRVPAINVDRGTFTIPSNVSFEQATFVEPLACALRGQVKAKVRPGQTVFVIGCGISGILHINLAKALGAGRIIAADTIEYRKNIAEKYGADHVLDAEKDDVPASIREFNDGMLADRVIICRGAFIPQGVAASEKGGTVLFFAGAKEGQMLETNINDLFWRTERTLTSAYAGSPEDCVNALKLIRDKRVNVQDMITHRFPLAEAGKGFMMVSRPWEQDSIKVIIEPQK